MQKDNGCGLPDKGERWWFRNLTSKGVKEPLDDHLNTGVTALSYLFYILTSVWVLRTPKCWSKYAILILFYPNAGQNIQQLLPKHSIDCKIENIQSWQWCPNWVDTWCLSIGPLAFYKCNCLCQFKWYVHFHCYVNSDIPLISRNIFGVFKFKSLSHGLIREHA